MNGKAKSIINSITEKKSVFSLKQGMDKSKYRSADQAETAIIQTMKQEKHERKDNKGFEHFQGGTDL